MHFHTYLPFPCTSQILTLPRGLPVTWDRTEQIVWDSIHNHQNIFKDKLLFAAASSWGKRE